MPVDIAERTQAVGNAMASVRIDQMILNLAKGIAWGQYELDKVGVEITKMMGMPGTVNIGGSQISMLEAGFVPSFYHFVDTILEIKMEVNIREEENSSTAINASMSGASEVEVGAEMSTKVSGGIPVVNFEVAAKASYRSKSNSAYSRSIDAKHSQTFSQDLSASSLMRTKLVPVPAPEVLLERIRILLDKLKAAAKSEVESKIVLTLEVDFAALLDGGTPDPKFNKDELTKRFLDKNLIAKDTELSISVTAPGQAWKLAFGEKDFIVQKGPRPADKASEDKPAEPPPAALLVTLGEESQQLSIGAVLAGKVAKKLAERIA